MIITVPKLVEISFELPPGLKIIDNFITDEEESLILQYFNNHWSESSNYLLLLFMFGKLINTALIGSMKHRQVKHYGYEFDYDNNGVRYDKCDPIPEEFEFILNAIQLHLKWCPNQITVNKYLPGQGKTTLYLA